MTYIYIYQNPRYWLSNENNGKIQFYPADQSQNEYRYTEHMCTDYKKP